MTTTVWSRSRTGGLLSPFNTQTQYQTVGLFAAGAITAPETVHVIAVEVAAVIAVASFILGFICNLLVMRKLFVSAEACRERTSMCTESIEGEISHVRSELGDIKKELQDSRSFMVKNYGMLRELSAKLSVMEPYSHERDRSADSENLPSMRCIDCPFLEEDGSDGN